MNTTLRNILNVALPVLFVIAICAICVMTHSNVMHTLADEIIPIR